MIDVTFLFPNKKVTKEIGIGGGVRVALPRTKCTLPPMYPLPRRTEVRFPFRQAANRNICGLS